MFLKRGKGKKALDIAFDERCGCVCEAACTAEQRRENVRTWALTQGTWPRLG